MSEELKPCPFCGAGTTQFRENGKTWTGMKYSAPTSVSVVHWCDKVDGQPSRMIERVGKDMASAIEAWNRRTPNGIREGLLRAAEICDGVFSTSYSQGAFAERLKEAIRAEAEKEEE